ncbi:ArsR family transcriptional regulator [Arthrobacter sp. Soil736]|uniref:ArsR/SmtB family transcription factor n=1 Tax=Arthrobacter sp. Soil736 TaxID=1736395 RepID=UPI0006F290E8|nr:metalloregulator ArsR/SmtB family transcription factor [Arthrobacter sp. Soil736]KRE47693.1 ArsR family transcriptional regulator [Arthrobacter sp. Soil736]
MVTDDVFAVIAEATRRDILVSLRAGDKAVGELVEELAASQPTISKHLKVLRQADLVSMRAQGQKRYYALNPKPLAGIASWLETFDVGPAAAAKSPEADTRPAATEESQPSRARPQAASRQPASASPAATEVPESFAAEDSAGAAGAAAAEQATHAPGRPASGQLSPAVVVPGGPVPGGAAHDDTVPQQIGRTVGRGAKKAADLLANLPKFGRKK